jgi:membrane-bound metal-dependent hydrolase YbcI (DUF457 family)
MPVIGHAFVGLATAIQYEPRSRPNGRPLSPTAVALWVPTVVAIAYLPDVVTQAGSLAGVSRAGLAGHSLFIGAAAAAVIAAAWALASGASFARLLAVSIGSVLVHDLLDILQATDRAPFWPWSTQIVGLDILLPRRSITEGLLFLLLFAAFAAWRIRSGRGLGSFASTPPSSSWIVWAARATVPVLLLAATVTHAMRGTRERQANMAGRLLAEGRYAEALLAADAADRWPWPAKPGRIDLIRGEAHESLGDSDVAERIFLRAYHEDPTNFWALADLAEFYAAREAPVAERRRLAQPYTDELRKRFPRHERLAEVLARVGRKLAAAD